MNRLNILIPLWLLVFGCSNSLEPVISQTTISVWVPQNSYMELFLMNSYNTRVLTLYDDYIDAGAHDFTIPEGELIEGVYNLVVIIDHGYYHSERIYLIFGN